MSDITKCANKNCKIKKSCYRFTAQSDPLYQSFADFCNSNKVTKPEQCEHFWKSPSYLISEESESNERNSTTS